MALQACIFIPKNVPRVTNQALPLKLKYLDPLYSGRKRNLDTSKTKEKNYD